MDLGLIQYRGRGEGDLDEILLSLFGASKMQMQILPCPSHLQFVFLLSIPFSAAHFIGLP